MVHGDDKGLVLPPRVASVQVVIVPCGITAAMSESESAEVLKKAEEIGALLKRSGVRVKFDSRSNYSPGWKFNYWELKVFPFISLFIFSSLSVLRAS
jgi:prolyl-tRNA synthetase